jgi:membrane dipeptidase
MTRNPSETARVHELAYPIDTHLDSVSLSAFAGFDFWKGDWVPTRRQGLVRFLKWISPKGKNKPINEHVSGPDFMAGGYGGACFSAHGILENILPGLWSDPWDRWIEHVDYVQKIIAGSKGKMSIARSPDDVEYLRKNGKRAAILSVEGGHLLGPLGKQTQRERLNRLGQLGDAGAAYVTLNHYCHTDIAMAGYRALNPWRRTKICGLSPFGDQFVKACISNGILVDLTHTNTLGITAVCKICRDAKVPVLASHAASRTLTRDGNPDRSAHLKRGLEDEAIAEIVSTGGCISVILAPYFLKHRKLPDGTIDRDATLAFVVAYYERLASLIKQVSGVADPWQHLSFGSDFDGGISSIPMEMQSGADLPKLTAAMLQAGWPEERIVNVYSGNFLRVWRAAQEVSGPKPA